MKKIAEVLSGNLKRLRKDRGLTQEQLAERAELSLASIQHVELGLRWVSEDSVAALARALQVPQSALFEDPDAATFPNPRRVIELISGVLGVDLPEGAIEKARIRTRAGRELSREGRLYRAAEPGFPGSGPKAKRSRRGKK